MEGVICRVPLYLIQDNGDPHNANCFYNLHSSSVDDVIHQPYEGHGTTRIFGFLDKFPGINSSSALLAYLLLGVVVAAIVAVACNATLQMLQHSRRAV